MVSIPGLQYDSTRHALTSLCGQQPRWNVRQAVDACVVRADDSKTRIVERVQIDQPVLCLVIRVPVVPSESQTNR